MIRADGLTYRYKRSGGQRTDPFSLTEVSFTVERGSMTGILGPNGAGKSTILKLLLKILTAPRGSLFVSGADVHNLSQRELARRVAYVPQTAVADQAFPVREIVAMGRYPHRGRFEWSGGEDPIVADAVARMELAEYADRPATSLSGGEFQRVLTARALAQATPAVLLDEPTNHLDLRHQLSLLSLLNTERAERELTILAIFHDIALALRYCDQLIIMKAGRVAGIRSPAELADDDLLERVYGIAFDPVCLPDGTTTLSPRLPVATNDA